LVPDAHAGDRADERPEDADDRGDRERKRNEGARRRRVERVRRDVDPEAVRRVDEVLDLIERVTAEDGPGRNRERPARRIERDLRRRQAAGVVENRDVLRDGVEPVEVRDVGGLPERRGDDDERCGNDAKDDGLRRGAQLRESKLVCFLRWRGNPKSEIGIRKSAGAPPAGLPRGLRE
jgi:hypothetical protein